MKTELRPCPHCPQSMVDIYQDHNEFWTVGCGACGTHSGISKDRDVVLKSWNNRPQTDKAVEMLEELNEFLGLSWPALHAKIDAVIKELKGE